MGHKTRSRKLEAAARSQHPGLFRSGSHEPARTGAASPRSNASVALASAQEWVRWLVPLLVVLCTLAAFLPTLQNHFVNWDDDKNFLDNHHYRGLTWQQLSWMWTTHLGHYIPLTWMTLGMDYLLWGMNPVGYHLTSLLLHAARAVVFSFVVFRFLPLALPRLADRGHALVASAGFAALVFAIHPLRVESVAWVTERRDVLSGLFYLLTLLTYLRSCERPELGRWWYGLSVALFGCALLSKSMAVSLPVVLLILEVCPLRRLGGSLGWASASARRVYLEKIPFVLLAAAASALALLAQLSSRAMVSVAHLSALDRLAVSAYGLSFYLWKTVVPLNLSPLYMLPQTVNPAATPFIVSYGGGRCPPPRALAPPPPRARPPPGRAATRGGSGLPPWRSTRPLPSLTASSETCAIGRGGRPRRSAISSRRCAPSPTMPSPTTTGAWRSKVRAGRPRRSTISSRRCASNPTSPSPTTTGARRSVSWASRPRRSTTSSRRCASIPTLPSPTATGAPRSFSRVSRPRRSSTISRLSAGRANNWNRRAIVPAVRP